MSDGAGLRGSEAGTMSSKLSRAVVRTPRGWKKVLKTSLNTYICLQLVSSSFPLSEAQVFRCPNTWFASEAPRSCFHLHGSCRFSPCNLDSVWTCTAKIPRYANVPCFPTPSGHPQDRGHCGTRMAACWQPSASK